MEINSATEKTPTEFFLEDAFKLSAWNKMAPHLDALSLSRTLEELGIKSNATHEALKNKLPLFTLLWLMDYYFPEAKFAAVNAKKSDATNRANMLSQLNMSDLVEASEFLQNTKLSDFIRQQLWNDLMLAASGSLFTLPEEISASIEKNIVKTRCNLEMSFLSKTDNQILKQIVKDSNMLPNGQPLNLKQDLCETIQSLNELSRESTRKNIQKCMDKLRKFGPNDLEMTQQEFDNAKLDVARFFDAVNHWDDAKSYYMPLAIEGQTQKEREDQFGQDIRGFCRENNKSCFTAVARLHATAAAVKKHAKNCNGMISTYRKRNLQARSKRGEKLSFADKFRNWF
jgi:hypothetical protein